MRRRRLLVFVGFAMIGVGLHLVLMPPEPLTDTFEWLAGTATAIGLIVVWVGARGDYI